MFWFFASAAVIGLGLHALMAFCRQRLLRRPAPPEPSSWPAVSILKPLKGADPSLEENLRSFFRLEYSEFEIVLGAQDKHDPALDIARRVAQEYPHIACHIVHGEAPIGPNPKARNLANLAMHAHHRIHLVSDSNVRVGPGYLRDLVSHLLRPGVGLVSSPFVARGPATLGTDLEALQIHGFVTGGVSVLEGALGSPCVVGKSMLYRQADLERIGGWRFLSRFLGEDQVCGEEIHGLGLKTAVASQTIENTLGTLSLGRFLERHLRWSQIRRGVCPAGYAGELLLYPIFFATAALAVDAGLASLALFVATCLGKAALDLLAEKQVGIRRSLWAYPRLALIKDMLLALAWPIPFLRSTVKWRGHLLRVGPRSELRPLSESEDAASIRELLPRIP